MGVASHTFTTVSLASVDSGAHGFIVVVCMLQTVPALSVNLDVSYVARATKSHRRSIRGDNITGGRRITVISQQSRRGVMGVDFAAADGPVLGAVW